ncbi:MAG: dTDP-glucose 4,6-dehydratase [Spirochaetia bacterium]
MSTTFPQNILVTGGAGFIGSNFLCHFVPLHPHSRIINVDLLSYAGNLDYVKEISDEKNYQFIQEDLNMGENIQRLFQEFQIDGVIHFAAESHVDNSIAGPLAFLHTNVGGTVHLLEAARQTWMQAPHQIKSAYAHARFYQISTDETYGSLGLEGYFSEETAYAPNSPYSASKAAADHFVRAYGQTYGLPVLRSNCSNNYGPKQHEEKFIPTIIRKALAQEPIPVYGQGTNRRDWLYVEDHCLAIEKIFEQATPGSTYNIGADSECDNLTLAKNICKILDRKHPCPAGSYARLITFVRDRPGHDLRYAIDHSKLTKELGWYPKVGFEEGLEATVDWYLERKKS